MVASFLLLYVLYACYNHGDTTAALALRLSRLCAINLYLHTNVTVIPLLHLPQYVFVCSVSCATEEASPYVSLNPLNNLALTAILMKTLSILMSSLQPFGSPHESCGHSIMPEKARLHPTISDGVCTGWKLSFTHQQASAFTTTRSSTTQYDILSCIIFWFSNEPLLQCKGCVLIKI